MPVLPYAGAYIGFPNLYNPIGAIPPPQMNFTRINQVELAVSPDLYRWERVADRAVFLGHRTVGWHSLRYEPGAALRPSDRAGRQGRDLVLLQRAPDSHVARSLPDAQPKQGTLPPQCRPGAFQRYRSAVAGDATARRVRFTGCGGSRLGHHKAVHAQGRRVRSSSTRTRGGAKCTRRSWTPSRATSAATTRPPVPTPWAHFPGSSSIGARPSLYGGSCAGPAGLEGQSAARLRQAGPHSLRPAPGPPVFILAGARIGPTDMDAVAKSHKSCADGLSPSGSRFARMSVLTVSFSKFLGAEEATVNSALSKPLRKERIFATVSFAPSPQKQR